MMAVMIMDISILLPHLQKSDSTHLVNLCCSGQAQFRVHLQQQVAVFNASDMNLLNMIAGGGV